MTPAVWCEQADHISRITGNVSEADAYEECARQLAEAIHGDPQPEPVDSAG